MPSPRVHRPAGTAARTRSHTWARLPDPRFGMFRIALTLPKWKTPRPWNSSWPSRLPSTTLRAAQSFPGGHLRVPSIQSITDQAPRCVVNTESMFWHAVYVRKTCGPCPHHPFGTFVPCLSLMLRRNERIRSGGSAAVLNNKSAHVFFG